MILTYFIFRTKTIVTIVKATATTMVVTAAPPIRPPETVEIDLYYLCGKKGPKIESVSFSFSYES